MFLAWKANISASAWKIILESYQTKRVLTRQIHFRKTTGHCVCLRFCQPPKSVRKSDSLRRGLDFCLGCVFPTLESLFMEFSYIETMCWTCLTLCLCPSLKRILKLTSHFSLLLLSFIPTVFTVLCQGCQDRYLHLHG